VVGDSLDAGENSGSYATSSWPMRFKTILQGLGYPVKTGWVAPYSGFANDPRFVATTGTWTNIVPTPNPGKYAAASGAVLTFTSDETGTEASVLYNNSAGGFTVSIDGGTAVTVTPTGANTLGTYTVTGLANSIHTIAVTTTSSTFVGVYACRVGVPYGIEITNFASSGSRAADWDDSWWNTYLGISLYLQPDLMVGGWGGNEALSGDTVGSYTAALDYIIAAINAAGSDLVLRGLTPGDGVSVDGSAYNTALKGRATTANVPFIDMLDRWGTRGQQLLYGLYNSDTIHPAAPGYADMALAVADGLAHELTAFAPVKASTQRKVGVVTTGSVANNTTISALLPIAKSYRLLKITTDKPARVRLYDTAAHRTADVARSSSVDPTGEHGCYLDLVTGLSSLTKTLSPQVDGSNFETIPVSDIPITVTNLSGTTGTVTVTVSFISTEV
jgi:lysophospholipase L1-like esterase